MAVFMLVGVATTLFAPEPMPAEGMPSTLREAVIQPFRRVFSGAVTRC